MQIDLADEAGLDVLHFVETQDGSGRVAVSIEADDTDGSREIFRVRDVLANLRAARRRTIMRLQADGFVSDGRDLLFPDSRLGLRDRRFQRESIVIDLITSTQDWLREATTDPARPPGAQEPVVALPFLVLMKLDASRSVDQGDLTRMLGLADEKTLRATHDVVSRYLPSDLDDLGQYIEIGKLEMGDAFRGDQGLDHA